MDKKFRLPKEGFIDDHEVEGHSMTPVDREPDEDVEGHRRPSPDEMTILPSPPSIGLSRRPGHGGELHADDEDTEGHRIG